MEIKDLLRGVIKEMVEARMRETDITDGSRVPFGSQEHVTDLEMRIADLERWRDRQRRGSEARANYARLIGRLRAELRSASRIANPQVMTRVPREDELTESVNMKDPEYSSIETFVQFLLDDERDSYNHEELTALNFRTRMPVNAIRKELEGYGLTLVNRPNEKKVRGFSSNSNDRWFGPGSMATHGGAEFAGRFEDK